MQSFAYILHTYFLISFGAVIIAKKHGWQTGFGTTSTKSTTVLEFLGQLCVWIVLQMVIKSLTVMGLNWRIDLIITLKIKHTDSAPSLSDLYFPFITTTLIVLFSQGNIYSRPGSGNQNMRAKASKDLTRSWLHFCLT